jgi:hypothetical protein
VTGLFEGALVKTIQGRLLDQFPIRARAIESVVSAHIRKDYFAVIPLALTLADGFCKDSFFIIDSGKKIPIVTRSSTGNLLITIRISIQ